MSEPAAPAEMTDVQRSSRNPAELRAALERWLVDRLPAGAEPAVPALRPTSANGMSSETLLFDATWNDGGTRLDEALVARVAPDAHDVPVFPSYDLTRQYRVIELVGQLTDVPVPVLRWNEEDPSVLGTPFFVMDRVEGQVPPDVMPYNFGDSWLYDASPADQRRLQDSTVDVLSRIHALDATDPRFAFLEFDLPGATPLARHLAHTRAWYEFCIAGGEPSPLIERTFAWLGDNLPEHEGAPVVCWGDSRIGNVMYRDFEPVAIFDWEMAGVGPRELELIWLVYAHRVFEDFARDFGASSMPDFLRWEDVAATYERLTSYTPRDLRWYGTYAGVQYGIVFLRTGQRSVHFGQNPPPADIDDLVMNRPAIEQMLAGTYW